MSPSRTRTASTSFARPSGTGGASGWPRSTGAPCPTSSASASTPSKPDEADGSGQYLTKVGYEMAMVDTKIGRGEGHRTPFAIAHDAAETGDMADIDLFREWVTASHRKQSITWSHGLRDALDLGPEKSDEELAAEDAGSETVAEIDRDLWRQIAKPSRRRTGPLPRLLRDRRPPQARSAMLSSSLRQHSAGGRWSTKPAPSHSWDRARPPTNHNPDRSNHRVEHQTH